MRIIAPEASERSVKRNLRRERRRWDDADVQSLALGCVGCTDRVTCGGLHKQQNHYNCLDDCCGDPSACDSVCPRNISSFIQRMREINGFDLENISRAAACPASHMFSYAPLLFHGNRRAAFLDEPIVALPLHQFYSRRDGTLRFKTRTEIERAFKIGAQTSIILVGSGRDKPIETWWGFSTKRMEIVKALKDLGISLATSPNYSLITDQPRYDDMYNIKRIGIAWQEFLGGQHPCALHINARTEHDYFRFARFIDQREEVTEIAFEFGTGAGWPQRREFHVHHLAKLARSIHRPLRLIMIGGIDVIPALASTFAEITFIDTSAFMNALHRQRLYLNNEGKFKKVKAETEDGKPVDDLLRSNIDFMRRRIESLINEARMAFPPTYSELIQESLETALSDPAEPASALDDVH